MCILHLQPDCVQCCCWWSSLESIFSREMRLHVFRFKKHFNSLDRFINISIHRIQKYSLELFLRVGGKRRSDTHLTVSAGRRRAPQWSTILSCDFAVLWSCGFEVSWFCKTLVLWLCGLVLWSFGLSALWPCGPVYFVVLLFCGPVVSWSCGPVVLWFCDILILRPFDPVAPWSCGFLTLLDCVFLEDYERNLCSHPLLPHRGWPNCFAS